MADKTLSHLLKIISSSRHESLRSDGRNSSSRPKTVNRKYDDPRQAFSGHMGMAKRFKKHFDYDSNETSYHPHLALTDVTLELFNNVVPNTGKLGILNMDYACVVTKAVCMPPCSMILAMMYLEQLRHKNPDYLEKVAPCDLFVISMLVASKYIFDDSEDCVYNGSWADAIHLDIDDLNSLEREFLSAINWELYTDPTDFYGFLCKVEQRIASKTSSLRGWLTYDDICIISQHAVFYEFWHDVFKIIVKVVCVAAVSYTTTILILYGASSLAQDCLISTRRGIHTGFITESEPSPAPLPKAISKFTDSKDIASNSFQGDHASYHMLGNTGCGNHPSTGTNGSSNKTICSNSRTSIIKPVSDCNHSLVYYPYSNLLTGMILNESCDCTSKDMQDSELKNISPWSLWFFCITFESSFFSFSSINNSVVVWPGCSYPALQA